VGVSRVMIYKNVRARETMWPSKPRSERKRRNPYLCGGFLEVGDEVAPFLALLQTGVSHLGAGDVLLGVLKVFKEGVLRPYNLLFDVSLGVRIAGGLASMTTENAMKVGARAPLPLPDSNSFIL